MKLTKKIIIASVLIILTGLEVLGETPADSAKVYFRVGLSKFDPDFCDNRAVMERFVGEVRNVLADGTLSRLTVSGYASPDGASDVNMRLSRLRCEAIADYISNYSGVGMDLIDTIPGGIAWEELRRMVEANPDVPSREKVLNILSDVPVWIYNSVGEIIDGRKKRLMELDRGLPYRWMLKHIFPELRNAVSVMLYLRQDPSTGQNPNFGQDAPVSSGASANFPEQTGNTDTEMTTTTDININTIEETGNLLTSGPDGDNGIEDPSTFRQSPDDTDETDDTDDTEGLRMDANVTSVISEVNPLYISVKTNMLYDAVLIPNIGAEFYVGKNLSLFGEWMYAWWDNEKRNRSWRIYGGDLGIRWWFGRKAQAKPLTGHHIGVYAGLLTFDFATGDKGYLGGKPKGTLRDRHLVNAGVEYGYSLPIAKRLNIDFAIGLGYFGGHYIKYFPFDDDLYKDKEINLHFFGPTKAEISLVWLIGHGNTNVRKGGGK